jgi:hypothetical protein
MESSVRHGLWRQLPPEKVNAFSEVMFGNESTGTTTVSGNSPLNIIHSVIQNTQNVCEMLQDLQELKEKSFISHLFRIVLLKVHSTQI